MPNSTSPTLALPITAPAPSFPAPPPDSNFLVECDNVLRFGCYDSSLTRKGALGALYGMLVLGGLCYVGFVLFRGRFAVYFAKSVIPGLSQRPPKLEMKGHYRLWSWLIPVFKVNEHELLSLAGMDAVVAIRINHFGAVLMVPMVVFGIGVLLPVYYTHAAPPNKFFSRMTISNLTPGSPLLWLSFTILVLFVAWTCFLLIKYYSKLAILKHTVVTSSAELEIEIARSVSLRQRGVGSSEQSMANYNLSEESISKFDIWPVRRLLDDVRDVPHPGKYSIIIRDGKSFKGIRFPLEPKSQGVRAALEGSTPAGSARTQELNMLDDTFRTAFGDDFNCIIPIVRSKPINKLLDKYLLLDMQLERQELHLLHCSNKKYDTVAHRIAADKAAIADVEAQIYAQRSSTMSDHPCRSFIATFYTQVAAAEAITRSSQILQVKPFHILPGADPENTNWPALEHSYKERVFRTWVTTFCIILIMLFPIGEVTGIFAEITISQCGSTASNTTGQASSSSNAWLCGQDFWATEARSSIQSWLPALIMALYQAIVLPIAFYSCAQAESWHTSLSGLDVRIASLFFYWNIFNFFLGALLGGSAIAGIVIMVHYGPVTVISGSASAASNFFVVYVAQRAFLLSFFRLFWPSRKAMSKYIGRLIGFIPKAQTAKERDSENPPRNFRFSREIGISVMPVFVCALGYSVVSPLILVFALCNFLIVWAIWKYQVLYVFTPAYDGGGDMWPHFAHRVIACLGLSVVFTGLVFIGWEAYVQGGLTIGVMGLFLLGFDRYIAFTYDASFATVPNHILQHAPRATIETDWYVPPALHNRAKGYYLDAGKVWQGWSIPRHGI